METIKITVDEEHKGQRLDKLLSGYLKDMSRTQIQQLIRQQNVTVNDVIVKSSYKAEIGDICCVSIPEPENTDIFHLILFMKIRTSLWSTNQVV